MESNEYNQPQEDETVSPVAKSGKVSSRTANKRAQQEEPVFTTGESDEAVNSYPDVEQIVLSRQMREAEAAEAASTPVSSTVYTPSPPTASTGEGGGSQGEPPRNEGEKKPQDDECKCERLIVNAINGLNETVKGNLNTAVVVTAINNLSDLVTDVGMSLNAPARQGLLPSGPSSPGSGGRSSHGDALKGIVVRSLGYDPLDQPRLGSGSSRPRVPALAAPNRTRALTAPTRQQALLPAPLSPTTNRLTPGEKGMLSGILEDVMPDIIARLDVAVPLTSTPDQRAAARAINTIKDNLGYLKDEFERSIAPRPSEVQRFLQEIQTAHTALGRAYGYFALPQSAEEAAILDNFNIIGSNLSTLRNAWASFNSRNPATQQKRLLTKLEAVSNGVQEVEAALDGRGLDKAERKITKVTGRKGQVELDDLLSSIYDFAQREMATLEDDWSRVSSIQTMATNYRDEVDAVIAALHAALLNTVHSALRSTVVQQTLQNLRHNLDIASQP